MRTPPALATALLLRLAPADDELTGDLLEEFDSGRSRLWFWRQVLAAIVLGAVRHGAAAPLGTLAGVSTGWATLLLLFFSLGDTVSYALAYWMYGWTREGALATQLWWPFQIDAVAVSYAGFALSGVAVARLGRRDAGPVLTAYVVSVAIVLAAAAALIAFLSYRYGRVPTPHTLFYVVSVTLPYQWRSGLLLAPLVTLLAGLAAISRRALSPAAARE